MKLVREKKKKQQPNEGEQGAEKIVGIGISTRASAHDDYQLSIGALFDLFDAATERVTSCLIEFCSGHLTEGV